MNKISLNKSKDILFLTGLKGSKVFRVEDRGRDWKKLKDRKDKPSMILSTSYGQDIILQDPSTNDLYSLNSKFQEVARIFGFTQPLPICKLFLLIFLKKIKNISRIYLKEDSTLISGISGILWTQKLFYGIKDQVVFPSSKKII